MAFGSYANKVQNGNIGPYKSFLMGVDTVTVTVTLSGSEITVQEVTPTATKTEESPVLPNPILDSEPNKIRRIKRTETKGEIS